MNYYHVCGKDCQQTCHVSHSDLGFTLCTTARRTDLKNDMWQALGAPQRTWMPKGCRRLPKLPTISATSAFMGATYTILNAPVSTLPSGFRWSPICARGRIHRGH